MDSHILPTSTRGVGESLGASVLFCPIPLILFALLAPAPSQSQLRPESLGRLSSPLPTTAGALCFHREKSSALSSLVDSGRIWRYPTFSRWRYGTWSHAVAFVCRWTGDRVSLTVGVGDSRLKCTNVPVHASQPSLSLYPLLVHDECYQYESSSIAYDYSRSVGV